MRWVWVLVALAVVAVGAATYSILSDRADEAQIAQWNEESSRRYAKERAKERAEKSQREQMRWHCWHVEAAGLVAGRCYLQARHCDADAVKPQGAQCYQQMKSSCYWLYSHPRDERTHFCAPSSRGCDLLRRDTADLVAAEFAGDANVGECKWIDAREVHLHGIEPAALAEAGAAALVAPDQKRTTKTGQNPAQTKAGQLRGSPATPAATEVRTNKWGDRTILFTWWDGRSLLRLWFLEDDAGSIIVPSTSPAAISLEVSVQSRDTPPSPTSVRISAAGETVKRDGILMAAKEGFATYLVRAPEPLRMLATQRASLAALDTEIFLSEQARSELVNLWGRYNEANARAAQGRTGSE